MRARLWTMFDLRIAGVCLLTLLLLAAACSSDSDGESGASPAESGAAADASPTAGAEATPGGDPPNVTGWNTDWGNTTIPLSELRRGLYSSDPRDGIPPIDNPVFYSVGEADESLDDPEPIAVAEVAGEVRAYPLRILTWHEIVNDEIAGVPVAITYCPLCNSAVGFDRTVDGEVLRFGVSGLLRNSDLVMWDMQTESLWQQISGEGIVGELAGTQLEFIPVSILSWAQFKEAYPDSLVLSQDTGYGRSYGLNPYEGYDTSSRPFLFSGELDDRYPAMERVLAVTIDGHNKAYPFSVIGEELAVNDEFAGEPIVIFWGAAETASALDSSTISEGRAVGAAVAYSREVNGQALTFESTGLDEFTDAETGSIWDLLGNAVEGPLAGQRLDHVIGGSLLWFAWTAFNSGSPVYEGAD
jgi:hypothetical protein